MIKKLIISAVVLAALISSKEANAFSIGGFARGLASSGAFQIQTATIPSAEPKTDDEAVVTLTFAKRRELLRVNSVVNSAIDDVDGYLDTFAGEMAMAFGNADCLDCANLKREQLVALGWSEKAMRIAYSVGAEGQIERALVIATDRGDVILGNDSPVIDMSGATGTVKAEKNDKPGEPAFIDL
ncbi:transglutaminase-like cysteine peptidase [Rhizobium terrae]|uniref:transglutaminase-like cysteine peptidase n=1 Tax=Rhizobium terrae TaxID=2171756 RepID=UPI000E3E33B8|nr:transglutaminase-like cysteine peptidase [Rhizobium terrae]